MRRLSAFLALLAAPTVFAAAPSATGVSFVRVWPQWHSAESFQSYYEYHTGLELTGKWTVVRSQPDERGGLYFLTRVENKVDAFAGATFVLRVIRPDAIETRVYTFPADIPKGSHLFELGLTGKDWSGQRVDPVAWELELQSKDGRILARQTSFIWEKPSGG